MSDKYSQIDIYEKGQSKNAFPLNIWFDVDFGSSQENYKNETVCEFINNKASGLTLALKNKDKKFDFCKTKDIFLCEAFGSGSKFQINLNLKKDISKLLLNLNDENLNQETALDYYLLGQECQSKID